MMVSSCATHQVLLLWICFSFFTLAEAARKSASDGGAVSSIGPVRLWPKKGAFAWRASLHRPTGIASALETSVAPKNSRLLKVFRDYVQVHDDDDDQDVLQRLSQDLFHDYPVWLCSGPVTFGFLKAVPVAGGGYKLQDRLFGGRMSFLTFGMPHTSLVSLDTQAQDGTRIRTTQCTVSHPITGGLLSRAAPKNQKDGTTYITCTLKTRRRRQQQQAKKRGDDGSSVSILTEIVDYRPWLAGTPPINRIRARLYLGSQSFVHAYATWRLHRRCWNYKRCSGQQKEIKE